MAESASQANMGKFYDTQAPGIRRSDIKPCQDNLNQVKYSPRDISVPFLQKLCCGCCPERRAMPKRRYEHREPSHEWSHIRPLLKDAAQIRYELIRPVIL